MHAFSEALLALGEVVQGLRSSASTHGRWIAGEVELLALAERLQQIRDQLGDAAAEQAALLGAAHADRDRLSREADQMRCYRNELEQGVAERAAAIRFSIEELVQLGKGSLTLTLNAETVDALKQNRIDCVAFNEAAKDTESTDPAASPDHPESHRRPT